MKDSIELMSAYQIILPLILILSLIVFTQLFKKRILKVKEEFGDEKPAIGDYISRMWAEIFTLGMIILSIFILWQNMSPLPE